MFQQILPSVFYFDMLYHSGQILKHRLHQLGQSKSPTNTEIFTIIPPYKVKQ